MSFSEFVAIRPNNVVAIFTSGFASPTIIGLLKNTCAQVIGPYLPILVEAVLLPFEDRIIYDSLLAPYRITFGGGIRANLKISLRDAQEREGIITSLSLREEVATY